VLDEPELAPAVITPDTTPVETEHTVYSSGIDWRILGPITGIAVFLGVFLPIRLRGKSTVKPMVS